MRYSASDGCSNSRPGGPRSQANQRRRSCILILHGTSWPPALPRAPVPGLAVSAAPFSADLSATAGRIYADCAERALRVTEKCHQCHYCWRESGRSAPSRLSDGGTRPWRDSQRRPTCYSGLRRRRDPTLTFLSASSPVVRRHPDLPGVIYPPRVVSCQTGSTVVVNCHADVFPSRTVEIR